MRKRATRPRSTSEVQQGKAPLIAFWRLRVSHGMVRKKPGTDITQFDLADQQRRHELGECADVVKNGTRPNTVIHRARAPVERSSSGTRAIIGPKVINRKESDAGYFVVFRKDSREGIEYPPFWPATGACHGRGSPYKLKPRKNKNRAIAERPTARQSFFLCAASSVRIFQTRILLPSLRSRGRWNRAR